MIDPQTDVEAERRLLPLLQMFSESAHELEEVEGEATACVLLEVSDLATLNRVHAGLGTVLRTNGSAWWGVVGVNRLRSLLVGVPRADELLRAPPAVPNPSPERDRWAWYQGPTRSFLLPVRLAPKAPRPDNDSGVPEHIRRRVVPFAAVLWDLARAADRGQPGSTSLVVLDGSFPVERLSEINGVLGTGLDTNGATCWGAAPTAAVRKLYRHLDPKGSGAALGPLPANKRWILFASRKQLCLFSLAGPEAPKSSPPKAL